MATEETVYLPTPSAPAEDAESASSSNPEAAVLMTTTQRKKAPPQRQQWSRKLEFVLSSLGYAVGFGNIWRYPYLMYRYGGGTFLIPYLIFVVITGIPLMTLEMTVAQYAGLGPFNVYDELCPAMKGLGVTTFLTSFVNSIQYAQLLAYVLYYFFSSFSWELPWTNCDNPWNAEGCIGPCASQTTGGKFIWLNGTCLPVCPEVRGQVPANDSQRHVIYCPDPTMTCTAKGADLLDGFMCGLEEPITGTPATHGPADDFFYRKVLDLYHPDGEVTRWESYGYLVWPLFGCLIASYLLVSGALIKGIQTSGKVVYFTALFPYFLLVILFGYGVSLPGAIDGITFYLRPNAAKLAEPEVWYEALSQVFFSLSIGYGGLMTLSSYNHFDTPVVSYAFMIATMNFLTSFFAGFVIFSVLGYIAYETNGDINTLAGNGMGLTFLTFPTALSKMSAAPLWSFLFFIMLVTVGLDTQMADMETQLTAFFDQFPWMRHKKHIVVFGVTTAGILGAMSMSFQGGTWMLTLLNDYAATAPVLIVALFNSIVFCYIYGYKRVLVDLETMVGPIRGVTRWYYTITWNITAPLSVLVCLLCFWATFHGSEYDRPVIETFPGYINLLGVACTIFLFIIIPIGAIIVVIKGRNAGKRIRDMFNPTKDWMSQEQRRARGSLVHDNGELPMF